MNEIQEMLGLLWLLLSYQVKDKYFKIFCWGLAAASFAVGFFQSEWIINLFN